MCLKCVGKKYYPSMSKGKQKTFNKYLKRGVCLIIQWENSIIRLTQPQKEDFLRLRGDLTLLTFGESKFVYWNEILCKTIL